MIVINAAIRNPVAVSLGAISGALCRYYLNLWFVERFGVGFPYGTFFINVTGCFLMGLVFMATESAIAISPEVKLLVATGFLGSYTTFSTYGLDTVGLIKAVQIVPALIYGIGSVLGGIASVKLGMDLVRWLK